MGTKIAVRRLMALTSFGPDSGVGEPFFKHGDILIETFPGSNRYRPERYGPGETGLDIGIFPKDWDGKVFEVLSNVVFENTDNYEHIFKCWEKERRDIMAHILSFSKKKDIIDIKITGIYPDNAGNIVNNSIRNAIRVGLDSMGAEDAKDFIMEYVDERMNKDNEKDDKKSETNDK